MFQDLEKFFESESIEELPHFLFVKIIAIYGSLTPAERRVADVLLKEFARVRGMNIPELAELTGCSEATVFRFSRKLGYETFADFRRDCLEENTVSNELNIFNENDSPISILRKTFEISMQALQDTLDIVDEKQFDVACEVLKNANKIVTFGMGDAVLAATSLYTKLLRINRQTYTATDVDFIDVLCSHLTEKDALVCFSHSGASRKVIQVAKQAKKNGAKVIAITNYPLSQLVKVADITLYTASFAQSVKGEIISKRLPELCIAESLFFMILMGDKVCENALNRSINGVAHNKM